MIRKILFDNDITIQTKKHILPISYGIINSLFLIEILLLLNYVNSSINLGQGIIYDRVILFYNIVIITMFIFVYILTPIFNAGSITNIINDNKMINYILSGVSPKDIIIEKTYIGLMNVMFCIITSLPIAYVSLFFGGINLIKIFKILLILTMYITLYNIMCVMISSYNSNLLISYIMCYLIGLFLVVMIVILLKLLMSNIIALSIYIFLSLFMSIIFYLLAIEGSNFKNF